MPSLHYTEATLPDGRIARIETYVVPPQKEQAFAHRIALAHPDAALIVHGLLMLQREGASCFAHEDEAPQLSHGYEYCHLETKARHVLWMTLRAKNSRRYHLVGLLEWREVNPAEAVVVGIYVAKQFRSLGVATELMHQAVQEMKADDYSAALVFVPKANEIASDFFASRDFQLVLRADDCKDELRVLNLEPLQLFWYNLDQDRLFE